MCAHPYPYPPTTRPTPIALQFPAIHNTIFYCYITIQFYYVSIYIYIFVYLHLFEYVLYCDACCAGPPGKQPFAEGGYPVEIKVNKNKNTLVIPISLQNTHNFSYVVQCDANQSPTKTQPLV